MNNEIKEVLKKFDKEVKKVEIIRIPYSNEDKKIKIVEIYLGENHFNIFKDILDCITDLEEENKQLKEDRKKAIKYIKEYCIDDEFYINLTNKEKNIIEVLNILEGSDK